MPPAMAVPAGGEVVCGRVRRPKSTPPAPRMLRRCVPCAPTRVPARSISRITKAARLVTRDKPPHFGPDGKRIFNTDRHLFNLNKRIGWAAQHKKPQEAMQTFAQLKASGVQPDIVSYTSLLKAFVEAKQWTEADTTFKSISQGTH